MMRENLIRSYKKIFFLMILLVCGILFWFFSCRKREVPTEVEDTWELISSQQEESSYSFETSYIKGTFSYGILGIGTSIKDSPVYLTMSAMRDSFAGTMKITLPGVDGKGVSYQTAVYCGREEEQQFVVHIPDLNKVAYFQLEILNQYGEAILQRLIIPEQTRESQQDKKEETDHIEHAYIGVLSKQEEAASQMRNLLFKIGGKAFESRVISYDVSNFPEAATHLEGLSAILIDDFVTSALSTRQLSALFSWVSQNGGVLILGTGDKGSQVLSGIQSIVHVKADVSRLEAITFAREGLTGEEINIASNDISFDKAHPWDNSGWSSPESCYERTFGNGKVILLRYSLTDHALTQWTRSEEVYKMIIKDAVSLNYDSSLETRLWYMYQSLGSSLASQAPNTFFYGIFFIVYIFFMALFGYHRLRRRHKGEYIWLVIPALSLLFLTSLFIHSRAISGTGSEAFASVNVIDYINKANTSYLLYRNEEGERLNVQFDRQIDRVEAADYSFYDQYDEKIAIKSINSDYTINDTPHGFEVDFAETVPGYDRIMKLNWATYGDIYEGDHCFRSSFTSGDFYFKGQLTNTSDYDFERIVLIRGNQYQIVSGLMAGEKRTIIEQDSRCWTNYDEINEEEKKMDIEGELPVLQNILRYLKQTYLLGNSRDDSIIVAGITEDRPYSIFSDYHNVSRQFSVMVDELPLIQEEKTYTITDINQACQADEIHMKELREGYLTETDESIIYHFNPNLSVWKLMRLKDSFEGHIFAFNYRTGYNEEILKDREHVLNYEQMKKYLTSYNEMRITYSMDADQERMASPNLSVVLKEMGD